MKPITIIGAGAVGRSIALALFRGGVNIDAVYSLHGRSAALLARKVQARTSGLLSEMTHLGTDTIVCVPDNEITSVAAHLVRRNTSLREKTVLHTSGALSSSELRALKKQGASVGSFHPMQTFPKGTMTPLNNVWISIEGDSRAVKFSTLLAKIVHGNTFRISKEAKVLYHTAGVFASNYFVTLLSVVELIAKECGIPQKDIWKVYGPIVRQTLENVISTSPAQALTGPIARGDVVTVSKQLQGLSRKKLNRLVPLYSALGIETARLARKKK